MPAFSKIALFSSLIAYASAQQIGTSTAEVHPSLTSYKCTKAGGCVAQATKIVIDANWRWAHSTSGLTNCYTGQTWDATLCPDPVTCVKNCAIDGANYSGTYGISTSGNAVTLKFVQTDSYGTNVGSRVFLLESDTKYSMFTLKNQEFTFDVDMSNLPCGLNGALYFVEMDSDGGMAKYPNNKAGAKYGTGYCDSQCPHDLKFIAGKANIDGWAGSSNDANSGKGTVGSCCAEMDIWEANSISAAYTPHNCKGVGLVACANPTECGDDDLRYGGTCDKDGCDFNSFRQGDKSFLGPGKTIDTTKKITVVTQFITNTGTAAGDLVEIKRFYVQGGTVYANSKNTWAGIDPVNSITDSYCNQQKATFGDTPYFQTLGGLKAMGASLGRGHVLTMSLWADFAVNLLWLDAPFPTTADPAAPGVARGTCSTSSGNPKDLIANSPNASVTYSNIKIGELGSTFSDPNGVASSNPPVSSTTKSTTAAPTTTKSTTTSAAPVTTTKSTTTPAVVVTTTKSTTTPVVVTTTKSTTTPAVITTTKSTTTTTKSTTTSSAAGAGQTHWGQCGGTGYTGATSCVSPYTCSVLNPYYSQCL